jgi:hypothetical protein
MHNLAHWASLYKTRSELFLCEEDDKHIDNQKRRIKKVIGEFFG